MLIDKVLVVDDDFLVRDMMAESVSRCGLDVITASSGEDAVAKLETEECQLAFVDLKMKSMSGIDVLKYCKNNNQDMLVIIVTAYGDIGDAASAMKMGAFDFILKPIGPDQLDIAIIKSRNWLALNRKSQYLQNELVLRTSAEDRVFNGIVGSSQLMKNVKSLVEKVARTESSVLITGESGTGKELIAAQIEHLSNPQHRKPYVRLNCAAVPENLLESELFGHEKGAFTGAMERRIGRFELTGNGTLLLDEISEISAKMQAKLLRVLQEKEFERVGGSKTLTTDARIIATSNRDLRRAVSEGTFRRDLYYRLNVFPIELPPLRDRESDLVELAEFFLKRYSDKYKKDLVFSNDAISVIKRYSWPGNVRELENVIERVAILSDARIVDKCAIPSDIRGPQLDNGEIRPEKIGKRVFNVKKIEKYLISCALQKTHGNQTRAAKILGFTRRTLINKLNQYNAAEQI